jgi:hypothetical protein
MVSACGVEGVREAFVVREPAGRQQTQSATPFSALPDHPVRRDRSDCLGDGAGAVDLAAKLVGRTRDSYAYRRRSGSCGDVVYLHGG